MQDLRIPPGALFRPYLIRLRSPAPIGAALRAAPSGGRVLSSGAFGRGSHEGVRLDVRGPSWLVLGESYNPGWTAECDGRSLGAPHVVDGFANGWQVGPGCRRASFYFAPQRTMTAGYLVGALACLVLLLVVVLRRPRRDRTAAPPVSRPPPIAVDDRPWREPVARALAGGAAAALVFGFVFALRAGAVAGPVVAVLLWRGISARALIVSAGVLLAVVVPLLYVLFPGTNHGGYDTDYAFEHLGAHWVAVAAFALLVLGLARTIVGAMRERAAPERAVGRAGT
ncbi:MAG: hypothetical protein JOZ25_03600 [Actinobacteria bacterium]|nr:hypothetical protein [Actinomycetota bacterium]